MWALVCERDPLRRQQMWWGLRHTGLVWLGELVEFGLRRLRRQPTLTVGQVYGREDACVNQAGRTQAILLE